MAARDEFLENVRRALGRSPGAPSPDSPSPSKEGTGFFDGPESVAARAEAIARQVEANADALMGMLQESGEQAGWKVARVATTGDAAQYVRSVTGDLEARTLLHSAHPAVQKLDLASAFSGSSVEVGLMAVDEADETPAEEQRQRLRELAAEADIGVTGVDYAIADTGTCVLLPRRGVSRLVSLLPPVYVAVVERGQVLPDLDTLVALRRHAFQSGDLGRYMSLITGPSRSADIEYTLVTGVHGPGEVHMLLVG